MKRAAPFAAVLLAGGRSTRMGRDKALLTLSDGRALWQRQLDDVLRPLGPAELFIAGPARAQFPRDARLVQDAIPGLGPLGGIAAALEAATAPLLVVLAIDLPMMTADFLRALLERSGEGIGVVPKRSRGIYEPLAAVYPKQGLPAAQALLQGPDRSMQGFVREGALRGWLEPFEIRPAQTGLFTNWNAECDADGSIGIVPAT